MHVSGDVNATWIFEVVNGGIQGNIRGAIDGCPLIVSRFNLCYCIFNHTYYSSKGKAVLNTGNDVCHISKSSTISLRFGDGVYPSTHKVGYKTKKIIFLERG